MVENLTGKALFLSHLNAYLAIRAFYSFCKNTIALFILLPYVVRYPRVCCIRLRFLLSTISVQSYLLILWPGLTPNNKIDSFLRLAFSRRLFRVSRSHSLPASPSLSLSLSTAADGCHCSTLRERDFPRYPLPTILLHTTSATSSRRPSPFLSRLLTAVCQPSTLPYFSRVLVRSGSRRWQWRWMDPRCGPHGRLREHVYRRFQEDRSILRGAAAAAGLSVLRHNQGGPFPFVGNSAGSYLSYQNFIILWILNKHRWLEVKRMRCVLTKCTQKYIRREFLIKRIFF